MTMDRVYNPHKQHGFQQHPPPHQLNQRQHIQFNQTTLLTDSVQTHASYQSNLQNHSSLSHHRQQFHQQPIPDHQQSTNQQANNGRPPIPHRPVHPPPPPPPLNSASQRYLAADGMCQVMPDGAQSRLTLAPNRTTSGPTDYAPNEPPHTIRQGNCTNSQYQQYRPTPFQTHPSYQQNQNYRPQHNATEVANELDGVSYDYNDHEAEGSNPLIKAILDAKDSLPKHPVERDERDILQMDKLCSLLHGFDPFPKSIRRALAAHAEFIVVAEEGKELIVHNEELDSFCVLLFGQCVQFNVAKSMPIRNFQIGDAFGICEPTTETVRFFGYLITRCENCAFLCVRRDTFYTILTDPANYPSKEILRHRDRTGNVVCVSQLMVDKKSNGPLWSHYSTGSSPCRVILPNGHIIVKGTESSLMSALVDGYDKVDPDYVDDFLLLFRVFMQCDQRDKEKRLPPGMIKLCVTLAMWLDETTYRDKVVKVVLTWLSSYYHDFELNPEFSHMFYRVLESRLLNLSMNSQLHLLHVTLSAKSKTRHVIISRSSREQPLTFSIGGGYEKNCGIFVTHVHGYNLDNCPYETLMNYLRYPSMNYDGTRVPMAPPRHKLSYNSIQDQKLSSSLKPGDQILEVNGTNFTAIKLVEAQKKLDLSTHLSLTVRYNPAAFYEMRALPEGRRKSSISSTPSVSPYNPPGAGSRFVFVDQNSNRASEQYPPASPLFSTNANFGFKSIIKSLPRNDKSRLSSLISSSKQFVKQIRDSTVQQSSNIDTVSRSSDNISDEVINYVEVGKSKSGQDPSNLRAKNKSIESGLSNVVRADDLNPASVVENASLNQALVNVLRVFNAANNDSRYLLVHEETTAREVVMIAVKEFGLSNSTSIQTASNEKSTSSLNWFLYEVSVVPESKTIKQKCLSEQTSRLAERASLCSRFYIKSTSQDCVSPSRLDMGDDSLANEILKENPEHVTLTSLNATLLAVELTLSDFDKFRSIEPQQFVYDTFFDCSDKSTNTSTNSGSSCSLSTGDSASLKSSSSDGHDSDILHTLNKTRQIPKDWMQEYQRFADISNREMFWVVCEILSEKNISRRVKIIKQFIRAADVCSQLRNYNSMFAIISGLGHSCVIRLKRTFEKLKPKYKNQLEKMRALFDPSRNMSNYRMCLSQTPPPAIPLFPQIKKDLTFTKEGRLIFTREPNDASDDEDLIGGGFSQDTIRRRGDLITTKSQTLDCIAGSQMSAHQPRSISYSNFNHKSLNSESGGCILINFAEIRQFTERVRDVIHFSSSPYSNDLLTNTKDNQRNQTQIRKMHEEWQMRKRIRHYISRTLDNAGDPSSSDAGKCDEVDGHLSGGVVCKTRIIYDERTLYQRSLDVESDQMNTRPTQTDKSDRNVPLSVQLNPSSPQLPPAAITMLPPPTTSLSTHSPTLSKSSSLSSCSSFNHHMPSFQIPRMSSSNMTACVGKFGTESTESLRKLKALSENFDN